jgi:hypothetical protein
MAEGRRKNDEYTVSNGKIDFEATKLKKTQAKIKER